MTGYIHDLGKIIFRQNYSLSPIKKKSFCLQIILPIPSEEHS